MKIVHMRFRFNISQVYRYRDCFSDAHKSVGVSAGNYLSGLTYSHSSKTYTLSKHTADKSAASIMIRGTNNVLVEVPLIEFFAHFPSYNSGVTKTSWADVMTEFRKPGSLAVTQPATYLAIPGVKRAVIFHSPIGASFSVNEGLDVELILHVEDGVKLTLPGSPDMATGVLRRVLSASLRISPFTGADTSDLVVAGEQQLAVYPVTEANVGLAAFVAGAESLRAAMEKA